MASVFDFLHDNIWGATVFGAFAFFLVQCRYLLDDENGVFGPALASAVDGAQIGFAFLGYAIFAILYDNRRRRS